MADMVTQHNIGALVAVVTGVLPESSSGGTINGSSIDRAMHGMAGSIVLHQVAGAETGSPTATSVQTKLQHSADNSTWADYTPPGASAVAETAALTAASTENSVPVDVSAANRFIRPVMIVTLTGGTSPTLMVASDIVIGGERTLPAV